MHKVLATLLFVSTAARAQPSAEELLRRVKVVYAGAQKFHFLTHVIERTHGTETAGSAEIAVDKDRVWFKAEGRAALWTSGGREETAIIVVSDGHAVWVYLKGLNQYKKAEGVPDPRNSDADDESIDNPRFFVRSLMDQEFLRCANLYRMSSRAKVKREEACTANGSPSTCYVIEIDGESLSPDVVTSVYTLWVEKQRYLVLRADFKEIDNGQVSYTNTIVWDVAQLNAPVAGKLFSFLPPQDAKEVESFFY